MSIIEREKPRRRTVTAAAATALPSSADATHGRASRRLADWQVRRDFERAALCPKPQNASRRAFNIDPDHLAWLAGKLGPAERRALRDIAASAYDVIEICHEDGVRYRFLVAAVSDATLQTLETFEREGEDIEPGTDDDDDDAGRERTSYEWTPQHPRTAAMSNTDDDDEAEAAEDAAEPAPHLIERLRADRARKRVQQAPALAVNGSGEIAPVTWVQS